MLPSQRPRERHESRRRGLLVLQWRELPARCPCLRLPFFRGSPAAHQVLSLTFPAMRNDLTNTGAFGFYAGCNFAGFVFAYLLLPETKGLTLEELDAVFSVSNTAHAAYQTRLIPFHAARLVGRRGMDKGEPLYAHEKLSLEERMAKGTLVPQAAGRE